MSTIFRKVSVKNGLPKVSGHYFVWIIFEDRTYTDSLEFDIKEGKFYDDFVTDWLEEIEIVTDENIKKCGVEWKKALGINPYRLYADKDFMAGATWIRDYVFKEATNDVKENTI